MWKMWFGLNCLPFAKLKGLGPVKEINNNSNVTSVLGTTCYGNGGVCYICQLFFRYADGNVKEIRFCTGELEHTLPPFNLHEGEFLVGLELFGKPSQPSAIRLLTNERESQLWGNNRVVDPFTGRSVGTEGQVLLQAHNGKAIIGLSHAGNDQLELMVGQAPGGEDMKTIISTSQKANQPSMKPTQDKGKFSKIISVAGKSYVGTCDNSYICQLSFRHADRAVSEIRFEKGVVQFYNSDFKQNLGPFYFEEQEFLVGIELYRSTLEPSAIKFLTNKRESDLWGNNKVVDTLTGKSIGIDDCVVLRAPQGKAVTGFVRVGDQLELLLG